MPKKFYLRCVYYATKTPLFHFVFVLLFSLKVFKDPHIVATRVVQNVDHPVAGKVKLVAPAVKFSNAKNQIRSPPPTLGQHTHEILHNTLGYSQEKIDRLIKMGAVA